VNDPSPSKKPLTHCGSNGAVEHVNSGLANIATPGKASFKVSGKPLFKADLK